MWFLSVCTVITVIFIFSCIVLKAVPCFCLPIHFDGYIFDHTMHNDYELHNSLNNCPKPLYLRLMGVLRSTFHLPWRQFFLLNHAMLTRTCFKTRGKSVIIHTPHTVHITKSSIKTLKGIIDKIGADILSSKVHFQLTLKNSLHTPL